jgi:16S rRNA (guanine527-N7)-methyltransferase
MPGIPLAIMVPDSHFTLLDSVGKKVKACAHFSEKIGLRNTTTVHARAEEFARTHANKFDTVVSRATAFLPTILEWSLPFLSQNGQIILYKTPSPEELQAGMDFCKKK